ncbi:amidohydrolase family protein [Ceratobasidium sp. AG-Ba]|nr:amidohydrolase family protein [Ceratobasidium sp. AG-Ba]
MHSAQLRRRQTKMDESARRHESKGPPPDDSHKPGNDSPTLEQLRLASFRSRQRASAVGRGRIQAIISAIAIALLMLVLRSSKGKGLPEAYALCSAHGEKNVWTVNEGPPRAECLVVSGKFIADVGSVDDIRRRWGDRATTGPVIGAPEISRKSGLRFIFLQPGQAVYPGFQDAHAHVLQWGWAMQLPLRGSQSIEEIRTKIKSYIQTTPLEPGAWIEGQGWDQTLWGGSFPTADDFDQDPALIGKPIVLARTDVHAYWVSNEVIRRLGPLPDTVEGGEIVRDAQGNPTGIFLDNAMLLIEDAKPQWTDSQRLRFFQRAVKDALSVGLTTIHDAATLVPDIEFFKSMARTNRLPIRLYLMGHVVSDSAVKIFGDGALGSWGSAMLEPYSDRPDTTGILRSSPEVFEDLIKRFYEDGWQVNTHCIGDRANNLILNIYEKVLRNSTSINSDPRLRIEHAQILTQDDLKRLADLGVIASVQPTHATSDMGYAETRLGPVRIKGAYAWRTLIKNGALVTTGSDFPVEGINPLLGFYAAVTRLSPDGTSPHGLGGWYPEQRMTRAEALQGMTVNAAFASFQEQKVGKIASGLRADLTVLSKDIMTIPEHEILGAKVVATMLDGRVVFGGLNV